MQNAFTKLIKLFESTNFQSKEIKQIKKWTQPIGENIFFYVEEITFGGFLLMYTEI